MAVGSFSAGLSGLNANSVYLNVIGNNLANINTIGFKSSSVTFMDLVSQTTGGSSINPMQPQSDSEFIAQLAQFSSLEQLTNIDSTLRGMADGMGIVLPEKTSTKKA